MKKILFCISLSFVLTSCKKWVDINENPNSANSTIPTAEQRLPPILAQFADGYESAGTRAAFVSQQLSVVYANNGNNWNLTRWLSNVSSANWPWQSWYVNCAVNITPLIAPAEKVEAWHYIGAAKVIKAWGFGYLADFYGMLPYDEFDNKDILTPKFDDGEYIQGKILALLDEAIADLQKTQGQFAPTLSQGDILNGGKVDNWIRLAWGLKARFLNHTSKKASYDPQAVLDAIANGPQTVAQSSVLQYVDEGPNVTSIAKEALQYSNTGTTARVTKLYVDYITNNYTGAPTGASNMTDPRLPLLVPRSSKQDGTLFYSTGVDMTSDVPKTGPAAVSYSATTNTFNNKDSIYVSLRKTPYNPSATDRIQSTGTWYTTRGAKGTLLTSAEMMFIKAEVLFRQSRHPEALTAYKDGIRQHMTLLGIPGVTIDQFLASTSVEQNPANLTMSNIMIQKYIALSYSPEMWVDLRRMNFCTDAAGNYNEATGVYKGFKRPSHTYVESYPNQTDWPRRFAVASYEINFNITQVLKANPNAAAPTYLNQPVWWDKP